MKKLFEYTKYIKPYWKQTLLAVVLLLVVVFLDLTIPRLVQQIIDEGIYQNDMAVINRTALLMLGISILSTLFSIGNNNLSVMVGEAFARDLREDLFVKIQNLSYGNLDRIKTGDLIVRLTSDVGVLQQTYRMSMRIGLRGPLLIIGSLILMVSTDPKLTLSIAPLFLVIISLIVIVVGKLGPIFKTVQEKLGNLNNVLQENIAGVRVVKAFVRKNREEERFEQVNEDFTATFIKVMRWVAVIFPILMLLINLGVILVVWVGGQQAIAGELSVGGVVAFTNYLTTAIVPLLIMAMLSNVIASGMASAERIDEVLLEQPEVKMIKDGKKLPNAIEGRVVFENVGFFYNGNCEEKVLDGIDLIAEPGQTVAILGATGSGKTTLINLIPRFYDVAEGRVMIDGIDVRELDQNSLLEHIAITPQETVLFSGSIRENIRYGRPESSDEEVVEAAKAAQADPFINELPDGYDTHVAARGVNLSGGQKQRIAIARAILMKAEILILDDATSSVDVETETKIQEALDALRKERTTFVVAQRISTVLGADKIIVLDRGKIVAEGNHAELFENSGIYREIYDSQLGEGNKHLVKDIDDLLGAE